MVEPAAPHGTTRTLPPPSANGSAPPPTAPQPPRREQLQTRTSGMRTALIAGFAVLVVAVHRPQQMTHEKRLATHEYRQEARARARARNPQLEASHG